MNKIFLIGILALGACGKSDDTLHLLCKGESYSENPAHKTPFATIHRIDLKKGIIATWNPMTEDYWPVTMQPAKITEKEISFSDVRKATGENPVWQTTHLSISRTSGAYYYKHSTGIDRPVVTFTETGVCERIAPPEDAEQIF